MAAAFCYIAQPWYVVRVYTRIIKTGSSGSGRTWSGANRSHSYLLSYRPRFFFIIYVPTTTLLPVINWSIDFDLICLSVCLSVSFLYSQILFSSVLNTTTLYFLLIFELHTYDHQLYQHTRFLSPLLLCIMSFVHPICTYVVAVVAIRTPTQSFLLFYFDWTAEILSPFFRRKKLFFLLLNFFFSFGDLPSSTDYCPCIEDCGSSRRFPSKISPGETPKGWVLQYIYSYPDRIWSMKLT